MMLARDLEGEKTTKRNGEEGRRRGRRRRDDDGHDLRREEEEEEDVEEEETKKCIKQGRRTRSESVQAGRKRNGRLRRKERE